MTLGITLSTKFSVMLSVVMLDVVMLDVVMLSVVKPNVMAECRDASDIRRIISKTGANDIKHFTVVIYEIFVIS
jgi:hypothetical protein